MNFLLSAFFVLTFARTSVVQQENLRLKKVNELLLNALKEMSTERSVGSNRYTGTVKFWNETKGYGFIVPDDGGRDVFVHHSAIEGEHLDGLGTLHLHEGQRVSFEIEHTGKGPRASSVSL